jgi:hypothetical protein
MARNKGRRSFNPNHVLDLGLQGFQVRHHFPDFSYHRRNGRGVWSGTLQPRLTSPVYQVEIEYRHGKSPTVRVIWPAIVAGAPHLYPDGSLCLYWPKEWRWRPDQLIAETIIPWTALWLYYYELWLDTGQWLGPSSHDQFPRTNKLE